MTALVSLAARQSAYAALAGLWTMLAALPLFASDSTTPKTATDAAPRVQPASPAATRLFAVEIQTGPNWDATKPPQAQAFFKEHSAHLKQLRDAGRIRAGARYGDKGLVVIEAVDEVEARTWMEADPSMRAGTFRFTLNEMRVFYPGHLGQEKRP